MSIQIRGAASEALSTTKRWATITEVSDFTGLSERTIRNYIADGILRGYRLGPRAVRLRWDEVEALFAPMDGGDVQ